MKQPSKYKDKILELRAKGLSYRQIQKELGCNPSSISYHCGIGQKEKSAARVKKSHKKCHPFRDKLTRFNLTQNILERKQSKLCNLDEIYLNKVRLTNNRSKNMDKITLEEVKNKFGENPKCYLTGDEINILNPSSYHFDHIIPRAKGGKNTIDNLGISTKEANMTKSDSTLEELFVICSKILTNHGYKVEKL